tara:strand:- start:53 stop:832 length:780 start_codon:yes stop_codon:yes gene_type:complete
MLYAWNASKKRVRNHGSCQFDPPVQKKPGFRVIVAPARNESNVYVPQVSVPPRAPVVSAREKEDLEEFYRKNILENERLSREAKARHEIFLKEKAARDEEMRKEQAARDEEKAARDRADAERQRQLEEEQRRRDYPRQLALLIKRQSPKTLTYWFDAYGTMHEVGTETPVASFKPDVPTGTRCCDKVYDELRDSIWPELARLTAARNQCRSIIDKYKRKQCTSRYREWYERAHDEKIRALACLEEDIKALGTRQIQLLK